MDFETGIGQAVFIIDLGTGDGLEAFGIDQYLNAVGFGDIIIWFWCIESHIILTSRAATGFDIDTKALACAVGILLDEFLEVFCGIIGNSNHISGET